MVEKDPVLSINSRRAKAKIQKRKNSISKKSKTQTAEQLNKKINAIKNILLD